MATKAPETPSITDEQIEAARPAITWIRPDKISAYARYFVRHGYHAHGSEPFVGLVPGQHETPAVILWPHREELRAPQTTLIRFYGSGRTVVVGARKAELMDTIARLRASDEAEREDRETPRRMDQRLRAGGDIPGWLLDE